MFRVVRVTIILLFRVFGVAIILLFRVLEFRVGVQGLGSSGKVELGTNTYGYLRFCFGV